MAAKVQHCLQLEGYKYAGDDQKKDIKLRFFHMNNNIRSNHVFVPAVSCPTLEDRKPRVDWTKFHATQPVHPEDDNHSNHLQFLTQVWKQSSRPPVFVAWLAVCASRESDTLPCNEVNTCLVADLCMCCRGCHEYATSNIHACMPHNYSLQICTGFLLLCTCICAQPNLGQQSQQHLSQLDIAVHISLRPHSHTAVTQAASNNLHILHVQITQVAVHHRLLSSQSTHCLMAGALALLPQPKPSPQMTTTHHATDAPGCPFLTANSSETTVQSGVDPCC